MNQQTRPNIALDEELDVLEAVWKKDPHVLRPEQLKRLIDAGRISAVSSTDTQSAQISSPGEVRQNSTLLNSDAVVKSYQRVQLILEETDKCYRRYYSEDEWGKMHAQERLQAQKHMLESIFNISAEELGFRFYEELVGGANNGR